MHFLHSMVRVRNLEASLEFYINALGLVETRRIENEKGRFTLVFLSANEDALNKDSPNACLLYTSPSPRDQRGSRMPSSA